MSAKSSTDAGRSSGCMAIAAMIARSVVAVIAGLMVRGSGKLAGWRKRWRASTGALRREQIVKRCAQSIDIAACVGVARITTILLQRRVLDGPATLHNRHRAAIVQRKQFDQTEIHQFDMAAGCQFDVRRFDITMQHRRCTAVKISQGAAQLAGPIQHLFLGQKLRLPFFSPMISRKSRPGTKSMTRYSRSFSEK